MKMNSASAMRLHNSINRMFKQHQSFERKLNMEEDAELYNKYKKELDEASYIMCKAYLIVSIGNEFFEEAQDILLKCNLTFSKDMRDGMKGMTENFDKFYKEMKQIMGSRGLDNFTHDYYAIKDDASKYIDEILTKTAYDRTLKKHEAENKL